jgi:uncharacterized cupin superfamily protein
VANVYDPNWDAEQDRPPFRWRRARVGRQVGARQLGASVFELAPGDSTFPLHVHHANEELIVVVAGRPTLRTLRGERELEPGEVVGCPAGRAGAHRLDNRSEESVRVMVVSTMCSPEINEYPDSGKVWLRDFAPGADAPEDPLDLMLPTDVTIDDYMEGETG